MKDEARALREAQIADAAHAVLAEKGYRGLSMLAVAKRARASNETLYRWYGDKVGLFRALIVRDGQLLAADLDQVLEEQAPNRETLRLVSTMLVYRLLSDTALALYRSAAADQTSRLGNELRDVSMTEIFPRVVRLFEGLVDAGHIKGPAPQTAATWFELLIGDTQARCITGSSPSPTENELEARVARAEQMFFILNDALGGFEDIAPAQQTATVDA